MKRPFNVLMEEAENPEKSRCQNNIQQNYGKETIIKF